MTRHLKPHDIVDALEGRLDLRRQAHLDGCATCQREVDALGVVAGQVARTRDVPEPSPLFWPLFSERVRASTNDAVPAPPTPRVVRWLRPALAAAAVVAVAWLVAALPRSTSTAPAAGEFPAAPVTDIAAAAPDDGTLWDADDASWDLVKGLASELPQDEIRNLAMPRPGAAERLLDALTPAERAEFIKLLQADMGGGE